jgi:hypothetical protein
MSKTGQVSFEHLSCESDQDCWIEPYELDLGNRFYLASRPLTVEIGDEAAILPGQYWVVVERYIWPATAHHSTQRSEHLTLMYPEEAQPKPKRPDLARKLLDAAKEYAKTNT